MVTGLIGAVEQQGINGDYPEFVGKAASARSQDKHLHCFLKRSVIT